MIVSDLVEEALLSEADEAAEALPRRRWRTTGARPVTDRQNPTFRKRNRRKNGTAERKQSAPGEWRPWHADLRGRVLLQEEADGRHGRRCLALAGRSCADIVCRRQWMTLALVCRRRSCADCARVQTALACRRRSFADIESLNAGSRRGCGDRRVSNRSIRLCDSRRYARRNRGRATSTEPSEVGESGPTSFRIESTAPAEGRNEAGGNEACRPITGLASEGGEGLSPGRPSAVALALGYRRPRQIE